MLLRSCDTGNDNSGLISRDFETILVDAREVLPDVVAYDGRLLVRHMVELIFWEIKRLGVLTFGVILALLLVFVRKPGPVVALMLALLVPLRWTFVLLGFLWGPAVTGLSRDRRERGC